MTNINLAVPVYNEEKILEKNILQIIQATKKLPDDNFKIIIADNASNDTTADIAQKLSQKYSNVFYYHLPQKGKGLAVKTAWQKFPADFYLFMDADLSTDLKDLSTLLNVLKNNQADLVASSRYLKSACLKRSLSRKIISKIYNLLIQLMFGVKISDMANGFKGVNKKVIKNILPLVKNNQWFFDSELILLTYQYKYKIREIPIKWHENNERVSRVNVWQTSWEYLKELIKLRFRRQK